MMNLSFGDIWAVLSTLLLIVTLSYIGWTFMKRDEIDNWGKRILILIGVGLLLCIFVVMRDDYVASMQGGIGQFANDSMQIYMAYGLVAFISLVSFTAIFMKNQKYRQIIFYTISFAIIVKAVIIELSRILM